MLFYPDYKAECEMLDSEAERENIILSRSDQPMCQIGKNKAQNLSNPTASKGIKLASFDRELKWIKLCEDAQECLSPKLRVFLDLRREYRGINSQEGWTAKLQANFPYALAKFLEVEINAIDQEVWVQNRKTFYDWWNKIIRITMHGAARRGLFQGEI